MQKIEIKEVTPSTAENKPTIIVDSTGAKMSGFDFALKDLNPGDIIEAELQVKGKYTNITSFNMLTKASPTQVAEVKSNNANEKQAEITARAKNTALMQTVELIVGKIIDKEDLEKTADRMLLWLMPDKLGKPAEGKEKSELGGPKDAGKKTVGKAEFKTIYELVNWALGSGLKYNTILEIWGVDKDNLEKLNLEDAYQMILDSEEYKKLNK